MDARVEGPSTRPGDRPEPGVISWFVRNRVAANLLLLGISLGGLLTLGGIPQEMIPETRSSALTVTTVFPGAGAEVIEDSVLLGLEETLDDVSGVKEIAGLATEGVGVLTVEVERWADFRSVSDEIRELPAPVHPGPALLPPEQAPPGKAVARGGPASRAGRRTSTCGCR